MSKLIYTKFKILKFLGLKLIEIKTDYVERYTDEDTEEIQDEIRLYELKRKHDGEM